VARQRCQYFISSGDALLTAEPLFCPGGGAGGGKEGVREARQGDVAVLGCHRRTWYCSRPTSPLAGWKDSLDRPAGVGHPDELAQWGPGRTTARDQ